MTINTEFIKNNETFFIDYDFSLMIFIITLLTCVASTGGKLLAPQMFQTNLVFYMAFFASALTI